MKAYNCGHIIAPDDAFSLYWLYKYNLQPELESYLCFPNPI